MPDLREAPSPAPPNGVRIRTVGGRTVLRLKSWASDEQSAVIAGVELPEKVGATVPGALRVLCTGPSDWLLVAGQALSWPARGAIEADCARQSLAVADLSCGLSVFEIAGDRARDLLSKGCGLDLDRRVFAYPRCARTRFAQLAVVIDALEDPDSFDLYVATSQAHYLSEWLNAASWEFS